MEGKAKCTIAIAEDSRSKKPRYLLALSHFPWITAVHRLLPLELLHGNLRLGYTLRPISSATRLATVPWLRRAT